MATPHSNLPNFLDNAAHIKVKTLLPFLRAACGWGMNQGIYDKTPRDKLPIFRILLCTFYFKIQNPNQNYEHRKDSVYYEELTGDVKRKVG